jgi:hypothetical protein
MDTNRGMQDRATQQRRRASDHVWPLLVLFLLTILTGARLPAAELEEPGFDMIERPEALTEQSKLALEELSEDPRYKATAEELIRLIWQAEITMGPGRIDASTQTQLAEGVNELQQMMIANTPGFNCLNARAQCEPLGNAWFDCELAMVICIISVLGIAK